MFGVRIADLGEPVEHLLRHAVALADLGGAGAGPLPGEGPVEDPVLDLEQRAGLVGILVEHGLIALSGMKRSSWSRLISWIRSTISGG